MVLFVRKLPLQAYGVRLRHWAEPVGELLGQGFDLARFPYFS